MALSTDAADTEDLEVLEEGFGQMKGKILDVVAGEGCGLVGLRLWMKNFFANGTGAAEELPLPPIFSLIR